MKKVIWILLALILVLGLYNCAGHGDIEFTESPTERVENAVKEELRVYICVAYDVLEMPVITTRVQPGEENHYEVTGEIGFMDADGVACAADYTASVTYLPEVDNFQVQFTLGTLYKGSSTG